MPKPIFHHPAQAQPASRPDTLPPASLLPASFLFLSILLVAIFAFSGCQESKVPDNPFDGFGPDSTGTTGNGPYVNPQSFAGLHHFIFRPYCANSGCHDGNFEPDFRTIESAYNTLVLHPVIKNDPGGSFTYRVQPGNPDQSVLWARLNFDIDGQSGIMPLVADPGSGWDEGKGVHLSNIRNWIQNGAKDIFGNPPLNGNLQPSMRGVFATGNGGIMLDRDTDTGPLVVPPGTTTLTIWFSFTDDNTAPQNLQYNKVRFSTDINGFAGITEQPLQVVGSPVNGNGYFGGQVSYYHRISLNPSSYASGTTVFFRAYVKDPSYADPTEIPSDGSANYIKDYFSFRKQ
jgi:hypothetical protein